MAVYKVRERELNQEYCYKFSTPIKGLKPDTSFYTYDSL